LAAFLEEHARCQTPPRRTANVSAGEEVSDDRHGGNCEPADDCQSYFESDHRGSY
jgi:hypothetical protein